MPLRCDQEHRSSRARACACAAHEPRRRTSRAHGAAGSDHSGRVGRVRSASRRGLPAPDRPRARPARRARHDRVADQLMRGQANRAESEGAALLAARVSPRRAAAENGGARLAARGGGALDRSSPGARAARPGARRGGRARSAARGGTREPAVARAARAAPRERRAPARARAGDERAGGSVWARVPSSVLARQTGGSASAERSRARSGWRSRSSRSSSASCRPWSTRGGGRFPTTLPARRSPTTTGPDRARLTVAVVAAR